MRRTSNPRSYAVQGLLSAVRVRNETPPVDYADARTSLADWRTAVCLAIGVPVELIHPVTGTGTP